MQENWIRPLGWEDPLEEGMTFTLHLVFVKVSILAWRILMDREGWWATVHRVAKTQTELSGL